MPALTLVELQRRNTWRLLGANSQSELEYGMRCYSERDYNTSMRFGFVNDKSVAHGSQARPSTAAMLRAAASRSLDFEGDPLPVLPDLRCLVLNSGPPAGPPLCIPPLLFDGGGKAKRAPRDSLRPWPPPETAREPLLKSALPFMKEAAMLPLLML